MEPQFLCGCAQAVHLTPQQINIGVIVAFPQKFKKQLEQGLEDVIKPDYVFLVYAICGTEEDACGWEGWMLESVFKKSKDKHPTSTGDQFLTAADEQMCPRCGKTAFRTDAVMRFDKSDKPASVGFDYEVAPTEYTEDD